MKQGNTYVCSSSLICSVLSGVRYLALFSLLLLPGSVESWLTNSYNCLFGWSAIIMIYGGSLGSPSSLRLSWCSYFCRTELLHSCILLVPVLSFQCISKTNQLQEMMEWITYFTIVNLCLNGSKLPDPCRLLTPFTLFLICWMLFLKVNSLFIRTLKYELGSLCDVNRSVRILENLASLTTLLCTLSFHILEDSLVLLFFDFTYYVQSFSSIVANFVTATFT